MLNNLILSLTLTLGTMTPEDEYIRAQAQFAEAAVSRGLGFGSVRVGVGLEHVLVRGPLTRLELGLGIELVFRARVRFRVRFGHVSGWVGIRV
eukprot:936161-Amorphochlora_amoeboformis.AAC.1